CWAIAAPSDEVTARVLDSVWPLRRNDTAKAATMIARVVSVEMMKLRSRSLTMISRPATIRHAAWGSGVVAPDPVASGFGPVPCAPAPGELWPDPVSVAGSGGSGN